MFLAISQSLQDLTGTTVCSDKPVALYSGNICTNIRGLSRDHLSMQLLPEEYNGRSFVVIPYTSSHSAGTIAKILGKHTGVDHSTIFRSICSIKTIIFQNYEFENQFISYIHANQKLISSFETNLLYPIKTFLMTHSAYIYILYSAIVATENNTIVYYPSKDQDIILQHAGESHTLSWSVTDGTEYGEGETPEQML